MHVDALFQLGKSLTLLSSEWFLWLQSVELAALRLVFLVKAQVFSVKFSKHKNTVSNIKTFDKGFDNFKFFKSLNIDY